MALTWNGLRKLPTGTLLLFPDAHDIYPHCIVPAGTLAIMESYDDEGDIIDVLPADPDVCKALEEWSGRVSFSPMNDGYAWDDESPVRLWHKGDKVILPEDSP